AFWKSLKARGNYRLSPIPVFILYDVQSSQTAKLPNCQTADSLFNRSSLSLCFIPTSSNKKADALASARIVLCD
ncbi:hypothetical protein, partial [Vibrio cholerae]|uniref:hypothetical protein n=1 Tax=Vibrio cholerae TaxID=666 RepID=UPI001A9B92D5